MKRLAAHPAVDRALAAGAISPSWARHLCTWTGALPDAQRDGAGQILLAAAAAAGAILPDLAALAGEIRRRTAKPDRHPGRRPPGHGRSATTAGPGCGRPPAPSRLSGGSAGRQCFT
ncbi:MAG: hypothetical protein ACLPKI_28190 [Streptosporangiaceae bacterium]